MTLPPPSLDKFERLLVEPLPAELCLIQLADPWFTDARYIAVRNLLDQRIYEHLVVNPASMRVRRVVLYDIPSDCERHADANAEHSGWITALVRQLLYLDAAPTPGVETASSQVDAQLRQYILGRGRQGASRPPDGVFFDVESERFERVWTSPTTIQNNLVPSELLSGPWQDRDASRYLWEDR